MNTSSRKNKWWISFIYALVYSILVTYLSQGISEKPTLRQMENSVFDQLQDWSAIDSRQDFRFKHFSSELNELFFINLDTAFFDLDKERVRRDQLAKLLDTLADGPEMKVIFLDFLFVPAPASTTKDSMLMKSMESLGEKLVLPYNVPFGTYAENEVAIHEENPNLLYKPKHFGYLDYRSFIGTDVIYRQVQIGSETDTVPSAIYALIQHLRKKKEITPTHHVPEIIEINYILRNDPANGIPAVNWADGSRVLKGIGIPTSEKIVFIGLFDTLSGKYQLPIDKFQTPVAQEMGGIYLIINSYLNVVTRSFVRRSDWSLVFLINLILALTGAVYFEKNRGLLKKWRIRLGEIVISVLGFSALVVLLYLAFHTKFPFVLTSVFFVINQHFYQIFRQNTIKLH